VQAARRRGIPVIAEIELASRLVARGRVIAITGNQGQVDDNRTDGGGCSKRRDNKVTVGGNIGAPLSAQVPASTPEGRSIVVEASSFQLEHIDAFPSPGSPSC